jgi:GNAT superfamily N-acetyltransferase
MLADKIEESEAMAVLPPLPISIRAGSPRDYDGMNALFAEIDALHREARPDIFQEFDGPARTPQHIERVLCGPASNMLVAAAPDGLAGLAVLMIRPPSEFAGVTPRVVVEIDTFVVRERHRRRRVGRRLLAACIEWARQRRATHVELVAHSFNAEAISFYESFGFSPSTQRMIMSV